VEEKENGRYIGLVSFPNLLVLGVKSQTRDVILNFFSVHEEHQLKVTSELAKKC
jgi:ATP adenylyltransferase/5',5'''-P-1,P-4-tetraphosphate phosphorylase II